MGLFKWIIYYVLSLIIIFLIDFIFKKKNKLSTRIILVIIKFALSILFAFLPLGGPLFLRPLQGILVGLYVVLLSSSIIDLIFLFIKKKNFILNKIISFIASLSFLLYGTINMNTVNINEHTLYSSKVNSEYSFIFISDVHIGDSQNKNVRIKMVEEVKSLDIDFVVLGGDISDDYTSKDEMIEFYSLFKDFSIPVYFIYGNHDTQDDKTFHSKDSYTIDELNQAFIDNNIIVLDDISVTLGDLQLIGRLDKSRSKDRLTNDELNIDNTKYTICLDHQPSKDLPNVDLQVSGHTHAGQFAPLDIIYNILGPTYGEYNYNNTTLIVSSGEAGWRVPFRTAYHSEIELISIKPNK